MTSVDTQNSPIPELIGYIKNNIDYHDNDQVVFKFLDRKGNRVSFDRKNIMPAHRQVATNILVYYFLESFT